MSTISQVLVFTCIFTTLTQVISLHGASLQLPASGDGHAKAPVPLAPPPLPSRWSLPWSRPEPPQSAERIGSLLVQPLDRVGVALPELKMKRFGSKCVDCGEVSAEVSAATGASVRSDMVKGVSSFFQVGSEQIVEVPHTAQVGEVVADTPALLQDNGTSPNEPGQVGFVAAAKLPPALSEVPPLPFMPDDAQAPGSHIHVSANIATQDVGDNDKYDAEDATVTSPPDNRSSGVASGMRANASLEDDAWMNFTAAESLHTRNRDTEALGTDAVAEALPSFASEQGQLPSKEVSASGATSTVRPQAHVAPAITVEAATATAAMKTDQGFIARHSLILFWLLAISFVAIIGGCLACAGAGFLASFVWQRRLAKTTTRSQVEDLPLCHAAEVDTRLPLSNSYDCVFSKPLSSCQLLRLEARIEGPAPGTSTLTAPLTGQTCVLYSVAVSRQLHDGIRPAPVAFASGSVDFVISLKDSPNVRINLVADEVSLFDMRRGRHVQRRSFAAAPDKWQDFILTHRAGTEWQTSSQLRADGSSLEFQECALLCNTIATFVGELHRGADGALSLRPLGGPDSLVDDVAGAGAVRSLRSRAESERWRTSWECGPISEAGNVVSHPPSPRDKSKGAGFDKVMASDDPALLDGGSTLISSMSSLLRRMPPVSLHRGGRSMTFMSLCRGGKRPSAGSENHTH